MNLKAAPEFVIRESIPISVSKAEVDPKAQTENGPSIAEP